MAVGYGHVYVAQRRLRRQGRADREGARRGRGVPGPSLVIAYSPCIAHGYDLEHGLDQQKLAVDSGYWPLYRFDPRRTPRARTRSSSTRRRRRSTSASSSATRRGSGWSSSRTRTVSGRCIERGQADIKQTVRRVRGVGQARRDAGADALALPERVDMDLATTYLGLPLAHPLITGASPLVDDLDLVRRLEDAGAAAITMHSLFEEQLAVDAGRHLARDSKVTPTPRRGRVVLSAARRLRARARPVSRADPAHQGRGGRAGHRVAQRRDRPRVDRLRQGASSRPAPTPSS